MIQTPMPEMTMMPNDSIINAAVAQRQSELAALKSMSLDDLLTKLVNDMVQFAISLTIAIVVFYLGKFIIHKLYNLASAILIRRDVDKSLSTFLLSLVRIVLYFILIVTVIGILGINTSSFLALFASAGVAIGMALSGTLQNFAGGVLILLLKPYRIGDYIEAQGFAGTVREIQIFHTVISTYDNKAIIIPNGGLSTGSINNWSREDYRRVDWEVAISYGDSVEEARNAILALFADDERIVRGSLDEDRARRRTESPVSEVTQPESGEVETTPEPKRGPWLARLFRKRPIKSPSQWDIDHRMPSALNQSNVDRSPTVQLKNMADSSIQLVVRAWVRTADYWEVYYDYNEKIYSSIPRAGLTFPFPQMDVHLK